MILYFGHSVTCVVLLLIKVSGYILMKRMELGLIKACHLLEINSELLQVLFLLIFGHSYPQ